MAVAFDNQTSITSATSAFTVSSNTNRILIVTAPNTCSGVTYGGVALTLIGLSNAGLYSGTYKIYYLIAPTTGTANIVISGVGFYGSKTAGAVAFYNVRQTNPINNSGAGYTNNQYFNFSWNIGSSAVDSLLLAVVNQNTSPATLTANTGQTALNTIDDNGSNTWSYKQANSAYGTTMGWSSTKSYYWSEFIIEIANGSANSTILSDSIMNAKSRFASITSQVAAFTTKVSDSIMNASGRLSPLITILKNIWKNQGKSGTPTIISQNLDSYVGGYLGVYGFSTVFTVTQTIKISSLSAYIQNINVSPQAVYSRIYNVGGSVGVNAVPTGNALAVSDPYISVLHGGYSPVAKPTAFTFSGTNQITLQPGNYIITLENLQNVIGWDFSDYPSTSGYCAYTTDGISWVSTSGKFRYIFNGIIDQVWTNQIKD